MAEPIDAESIGNQKQAQDPLAAYSERLEQLVRERTRELRELSEKLQKTLDEIKTLGGFLRICAYCKKIRDDKGFWTQIERYLYEHTGTLFSHGICPECEKRVIAELDESCPPEGRAGEGAGQTEASGTL